LKPKEKSTSPVATPPFAVGDLVAYVGNKQCYLNKVGTVYKMKVDACHVQFFDDPDSFRLTFDTIKYQMLLLATIIAYRRDYPPKHG
jgi:hypothetical protein